MNIKVIALLAGAAIGMAFIEAPKTEKGLIPIQTKVQGEWTPLFDGKSFEGWSKYGGGAVGNAWKIENGELYLDAANKANWQKGDAGDIVTNEEFENFHFKYEWKIAPNGNSGVIFLVHPFENCNGHACATYGR